MSDSLEDVPGALARGHQPFLGREFFIGRGVPVPRPETELLARTALSIIATLAGEVSVIDMCCGSGNLGVSIAASEPRARVWCADLLEPCVSLARKNASHLGVAERVEVYEGDLFAALPASLHGKVSVVVCNPPYISTGRLAGDRAVLLEQEPREAFDGGAFGLAIHQRVIAESLAFLTPGGALLFEFGLGQERQMRALFARSKKYRDLRFVESDGLPRACVAFSIG